MILLLIYMVLTAIVAFGAALMERHAIEERISGANGFVWTMLMLICATVLVPVGLIVWVFDGFRMALICWGAGAAWLYLLVRLSMWIMTGSWRKS